VCWWKNVEKSAASGKPTVAPARRLGVGEEALGLQDDPLVDKAWGVSPVGAGQEAGPHGQDGSAVLAARGEAVDLSRADRQQAAGACLVPDEVDHVAYGAAVEPHHEVEVDAVHAVERLVGVPPVAARRSDLYAHAPDAPVGSEGEGSDPAPAATPRAFVRHAVLVPS
jgi:hypothetical protein